MIILLGKKENVILASIFYFILVRRFVQFSHSLLLLHPPVFALL